MNPFKTALRWLIGVEEEPLTEAERKLIDCCSECTLCDVNTEST